jgi:hypothetical protein
VVMDKAGATAVARDGDELFIVSVCVRWCHSDSSEDGHGALHR